MNIKIKIGDLFDIHPTKAYKFTNDELFKTEGKTPVLSNSSIQNGISGYSGLPATENGNMITFSDTTSGQDTIFYQPDPFIGYPHVQGLYPKQPTRWNQNVCLYFIAAFKKSAGNQWSYAIKFTRDKVRDLDVQLPVKLSDNPDHVYTIEDIDWEYMYDYIQELEQDYIKELDTYLKATGLDDYTLAEGDKEVLGRQVEYHDFLMEDIFHIAKGKRLTKADQLRGNTLFIGATALNHGETGRIGQEPIFPAGTITVSYNGSVGEAFYQTEPYWASDDINVCSLKGDHALNETLALYLCAAIRKAGQAFAYNQKWNLARMKVTAISLPVTASGQPDWEYMERYIRAMEKLAICDVVDYKNKWLETAREVAGAE